MIKFMFDFDDFLLVLIYIQLDLYLNLFKIEFIFEFNDFLLI